MKKQLGNNAATARVRNIALIIKLINRAGVCSRADLAAKTGLTQAGITYITKELIERGLIREVGVMEGKSRHPSIGLAIDRGRHAVIGAQINRNYVRAGLYTFDGVGIDEKSAVFSEAVAPAVLMDKLFLCISELLGEANATHQVAGIGVALPGPFLPAQGKIGLMSGAPGWSDIDIRGSLEERFRLPVTLEHDANCGALAELWYGDTDTQRNILFVNVADGIGAGIICEGKLYRGQIGTAGEIGHMSVNFAGPSCECGNRGCLELYCSLKKLRRDYAEILLESGVGGDADASGVLALAREGDETARRALSRSATYLGFGLASLVNVLGPGTIILADRFSDAGAALTEMVRGVMNRYLLPEISGSVAVRLASEPRENIILRGAAVAVLEHLLAGSVQPFAAAE